MEEIFKKYVELQRSGKYNMVADAKIIMILLCCTKEQYFDILNNYDNYYKKYMED